MFDDALGGGHRGEDEQDEFFETSRKTDCSHLAESQQGTIGLGLGLRQGEKNGLHSTLVSRFCIPIQYIIVSRSAVLEPGNVFVLCSAMCDVLASISGAEEIEITITEGICCCEKSFETSNLPA